MRMDDLHDIKGILEAALLTAGEAVPVGQLADAGRVADVDVPHADDGNVRIERLDRRRRTNRKGSVG